MQGAVLQEASSMQKALKKYVVIIRIGCGGFMHFWHSKEVAFVVDAPEGMRPGVAMVEVVNRKTGEKQPVKVVGVYPMAPDHLVKPM